MSDAKQERITIVVGNNGTVGIEFDGFAGDDCLREAKEIEAQMRDLGVAVEVRARKMHAVDDPRIPEVSPQRDPAFARTAAAKTGQKA